MLNEPGFGTTEKSCTFASSKSKSRIVLDLQEYYEDSIEGSIYSTASFFYY